MDPSLKRDYIEVFSSSPGQRVLEDLCSKLGLSSSSFIAGDPHQTAYREGMRHAALLIISTIERPALAIIEKKYKTNQRNLNV
jgi:hypothetical protein